jgi:hypothetical protein
VSPPGIHVVLGCTRWLGIEWGVGKHRGVHDGSGAICDDRLQACLRYLLDFEKVQVFEVNVSRSHAPERVLSRLTIHLLKKAMRMRKLSEGAGKPYVDELLHDFCDMERNLGESNALLVACGTEGVFLLVVRVIARPLVSSQWSVF